MEIEFVGVGPSSKGARMMKTINEATRRDFLRCGAVASLTIATARPFGRAMAQAGGTDGQSVGLDMQKGATELTVQPLLMYAIPQRVEGRSWRSWGSLQSEEAVEKEAAQIDGELKQIRESSGFKLRTLPLARVTSVDRAKALKDTKADVLLVYAAGGWTDILDTLAGFGKKMIIFIRHRKGAYYLWDEIVHSRFLRSHTDRIERQDVGIDDVAVDEPEEIQWRLCALHGLKNTIGRRIICVGGPGGWACPQAPDLARARFQLDMVTLDIPEINAMITAARKDDQLMAQCRDLANRYIDADGVKLTTTREAVAGSFLLKKLFHDVMDQHDCFAVTTRGCMGSYAGIMPCLTLTLINDDGYMAYCEGDFVAIPAHILTHYICGKPTYFCNPTFPHQGRMMFAHCTAPRRMDGENLAPVELVTHYESDHGAATHVDFPQGQLLTVVKPDFEAKRWLAFTGKILGAPFIDTCRAQVEVELNADTAEVLGNLRGFHCVLAYGDHTKEVAYAAKKVGIEVQTLRV
jgi:hypothetical protein